MDEVDASRRTDTRAPSDPDAEAFAFVEAWARDAGDALDFDGVNLGHACRRTLTHVVATANKPRAYADLAAREATFLKTWGLPSAMGAGSGGHKTSWLIRTAAPFVEVGLAAAQRAIQPPLRPTPSRRRIIAKDSKRLSHLLEKLNGEHGPQVFYAGASPLARQATPYLPVISGMLTPRRRLADFEASVRGVLGKLEACTEWGIDLIMAEARRESARTPAILRAIERSRPDAILLQDDTTPDGLTWALAAACAGTRTLTLAHGLDCERHFLDAVFADVKCVWGPARADSLTQAAGGAPLNGRVVVTGNPAYDGCAGPAALGAPGTKWLWATRPHTPRKLFSAGRFAQEGADILSALLGALLQAPGATLAVKPHPTDYSSVYGKMIAAAGCSDRATIVKGALDPAVAAADVVVAEDTTAALDACLAGKPLVHAHFAPTPPALPLVAYDAALPGSTPEQLAASMLALSEPDAMLRSKMFAGQQAFLRAFAGPLDGLGGARVLEELAGLR